MENKRRRETEELSDSSQPDAKRLQAQVILEIFDDDDDEGADAGGGGDPSAASDDLATVMRSLEQEIALAPPASPPPELGYLLEASDDELGIPPPAEEQERNPELEAAAALWFADDQMSRYCYDGLGFGFGRYEADGSVVTMGEEEESALYDGAPFEYAHDQVWAN
ncbi:hypothetical protein Cni_G01723 [Canna indica]|uniref:Uncharacterized protein n=1 Tax=Canna indica TaxID=4628 RepID=A0AAQ3PYP4_9LILI|nr:hypothetical protein Cni_G01723 [Canna indica]